MAKIGSDMIKPFNGEGDVVAWLQKVELVASLTNVKDVAKFIPLYLEDGAMAVYLEMEDDDKLHVDKIKDRLKDAFTDGMFMAYARLKRLRWNGESVDVYGNEIRRLAREAGFVGEALEHLVRLTFITGFPDDVGLELQQIDEIKSMPMGKIIARARILTANRQGRDEVAAPTLRKPNTRKMECFRCGGPHMIRDCDKPRPSDKPIRCFRCGEAGHMASRCSNDRKPRGDWCASGTQENAYKVPIIEIVVNGEKCLGLVDTGCSVTMVRIGLPSRLQSGGRMSSIKTVDGRNVGCEGFSEVQLEIEGKRMWTKAMVMESLVGGLDAVIGMDVIRRLGGVTVKNNSVDFGKLVCAMAVEKPDRTVMKIDDKDFEAKFDGKHWTVRYFWKNSQPPILRNKTSEYAHGLDGSKREAYEMEVERWISEGILMPWEGEESEGIIPLMAVEQETKGKIGPVLDFRELNRHIECHTGDDIMDVCGDRLREWRQMEGGTEIVDLKSAYLQIYVDNELFKHQLVMWKGRKYCLTRLGFGLCSAPKIMSKILKTVLAANRKIIEATSSYIDDIMVDTSAVSSQDLVRHLAAFGFVTKTPERLEKGRALGLQLDFSDGKLCFTRGNEIPQEVTSLTRKELFSLCGKLVGHYPVAGWLRIACSYAKRISGNISWESQVDERLVTLMNEMLTRVHVKDPVHGAWNVPKLKHGRVWCDASDIGLGVVLEIGGVTVEDSAWLRKKDDYNHINVAELEAVLKGVNLCVKWGLDRIEVMTDSVTVRSWIECTLSEEKRVKTKGAAEMLVKRRLGTLKTLITELGIQLIVAHTPSAKNKADTLTRVKQTWLQYEEQKELLCASGVDVKRLHAEHHMGVERTWYLAKKIDPTVTKDQVKKVVRECGRCQSINPAPVNNDGGEVSVCGVWKRVAIDVTHYRNIPYLSIVDCGPGRFAIWRELKCENAECVSRELEQIFLERGPVDEVLMDNGSIFKTDGMMQLFSRWNIRPFFRAAYRPSGNGIVERNHRTIKSMSEKSGISPVEAVFWYNSSPRYGQRDSSVPCASVYAYKWRHPSAEPERLFVRGESTLREGDEVWVKPPQSKCTTQWKRGMVTSVNTSSNVEVDGMPRHVLDLRRIVDSDSDEDDGDSEADELEMLAEGRRHPERERRPPRWMSDYEC